MQQRAALAARSVARCAAIAALAPMLVTSAMAATSADQAFVDAFAQACVPGRLSFEATRDTALAAGWQIVERNDHPDLASVLRKADEMIAAESDLDAQMQLVLLARDVNGTRHHLTVAESTFVIEEGDDPWVMVGCNLYNFDATAPVDPAPVTALIGKPIAMSHDRDGLIGHVWGPPCPMPRTGDTYLSFVAEGSPTEQLVGFAGVTLNFSTSTPDEGEEVSETYC